MGQFRRLSPQMHCIGILMYSTLMWVFFYYLARFWFQPLCFMQQLVNKRQIRRYSTMWHRTLVRHWLALRHSYPHTYLLCLLAVTMNTNFWYISVTNPSLSGILIFVSRKTPRPTKLLKYSIHIIILHVEFYVEMGHFAGESAHFICEIQIFRCESKSS
jgi:hypothetical protein